MKKRNLIFGVLRFIGGTARTLYAKSKYKIKPGYRHRKAVEDYSDLGRRDEYQKEVYEKAAAILREKGWTNVIDIGCGSGYKLIHNMGHLNTVGVDTKETIEQVKKDYPNYTWISLEQFTPSAHTTDMIICADVIEHVQDPDVFLKNILSIRDWKILLLSTPERDIKRGRHHFGPSPNPAHFREWNKSELVKYLSGYVNVRESEVVNVKQGTQLLMASPK